MFQAFLQDAYSLTFLKPGILKKDDNFLPKVQNKHDG